MGPAGIAMTVGALGGAEALGNRQAVKQQRNILTRAMTDASRTQQRAIDTTLDEARTLAPGARMQAMQDQEGQIAGQLERDLSGATTLGTPAPGNVSDAYQQALLTRSSAEGDRTSALVRELSRMRAPGDVLNAEGLRRSNMAETLQSMWGSTNNRTRAAEMDANSVAPPWWAQTAGLGRQIGSAYLLGSMIPTGGKK